MFWTDWGKSPKIERAGLDGGHRVTLVNNSIFWPTGIAIDFKAQKIYWADSRLDKIEVMNMDGSQRSVVLDQDILHVFGFTLLGSQLYWTDSQKRSIESVNKRTGDGRKTLIQSLPDLNGLKAVNLNLDLGEIILLLFLSILQCNPCHNPLCPLSTTVYLNRRSEVLNFKLRFPFF